MLPVDLGSIFLIVALALLVSLFISRPFFSRAASARLVEQKRQTDVQTDHLRSTLLAERDRLLTALQELDFDNTLGKIPPEDYPAQRAELLTAGAEVLRKLDAVEQHHPSSSAEERIEQAAAAHRADASMRPRLPSADQDELETLIAARRRARQEKSAGFCPKCGRPLQQSDKFCSSCGTTIKPVSP
jgi:NADH pyrophosphatase NudC (nudix superfamily)